MTLLRRVIGRALRRARRNQGKTLRDVADSARVSIQYLSEVERGRKEASSEVLAAICSAHGWTLLDLLDEVRSELRADARAATTLEVARPVPAVAPASIVPTSVVPASIVPTSPPVHSIAPSAGAQVRLAA